MDDMPISRSPVHTPQRPGSRRRGALALALAAGLLALLTACSGNRASAGEGAGAQLAFGVDMAERGLWSEALFRFHQAERLDPSNPRILNNLAVAYEATGAFDRALEYYQKALRAAPDNREARANYARFVEFYQSFRPRQEKAPAAGAAVTGDQAAPPGQAPPAEVQPPPAEEPPAEEPPVEGSEPPPAAPPRR